MITWEVTIGGYVKKMKFNESLYRQLSNMNKHSFRLFGKPCVTWRFIYN